MGISSISPLDAGSSRDRSQARMDRRRKLFAALLVLLAVAPGCRTTDCCWYTSRFGLTRADWTPPTRTEKSQPGSTSPSDVNEAGKRAAANPKADHTPGSRKSLSAVKSNLIQLVGFNQERDKDVSVAHINPTQQNESTTNGLRTQKSNMEAPVSTDPRLVVQPAVQGVASNVQIELASAQEAQRNLRSFDLPADFPGGNVPPIRLPKMDSGATAKQRQSIVDDLFANLPRPTGIVMDGDSQGRTITLTELQDLALANNPSLQQAIARVENARGQMIQAGLYPNPTIGYQGDTIGTANTAGYNGLFASQTLITAGKLGIAQAAARAEMRAAEHDLRTQRISVASTVRSRYFAILVAQERIRLYQGIQSLAQQVYDAQKMLVAGGESAVYEPLQLRVLAVMAGNNVLTAQNDYAAAWRQLAAALGVPTLPISTADGSIEMDVPQIRYEQAIDIMLARNAGLNAAQARIASNQYRLRLQQVTPVPDVLVYSALQHDDTSSLTPNRTSFNVQVSVPVPIFNRNQGNITSARASLVQADRDLDQTRNQLLSDMADAYNRYITGQAIVENYRNVILPDQVRVYRATYERFRIAGQEVDFAQIVVSQQTLAQAVVSYLDAVSNQWQAAVDVAQLLQVDDLFTFDRSPEEPVQQFPQGEIQMEEVGGQ